MYVCMFYLYTLMLLLYIYLKLINIKKTFYSQTDSVMVFVLINTIQTTRKVHVINVINYV